ncbi:MAG: hypothetical protein SGARI_004796, partial [Bacillariaceae sp.]
MFKFWPKSEVKLYRNFEGKKFNIQVAQAIETFFLCDHCTEVEVEQSSKHGVGEGRHYSKSLDDDDSTQGSTKGSRQKGSANPIEDAVKSVGKFLKHLEEPGKLSKSATSGVEKSASTPVVPITRKTRKSIAMRQLDDDELKQVGEEANLLLDDERPHTELVPNYSSPVPSFQSKGSKIGLLVENNPIVFAFIAVVVLIGLRRAANVGITVDGDIALLFLWGAFCFGLHTPRPMISGVDKHFGPPPSTPTGKKKVTRSQDRDGRKLLRMSMVSTPEARSSVAASGITFDDDMDDDIMEVNQSPLPRFPAGAELGTVNNCWSEPEATNFHVRGANYLKDKVKIESADFLFPVRGLDLFLTDTCPENVG